MKSLICWRKHTAVLLTASKAIICIFTWVFTKLPLWSLFWWKVKIGDIPRDHHRLWMCLYPTAHIEEMLCDNISQLGGLGPRNAHLNTRNTDTNHRLPPPSQNVEHLTHSWANLGDFVGHHNWKEVVRAAAWGWNMTHSVCIRLCVFVFQPSRKLANIQLIILSSKLAVLTAYQRV